MGIAVNVAEGRYPAPAKLNLFLHVVGRRQDGYHLLQTVFRFLDVGDELEIECRQDGEIRLLNRLPGVEIEQDLCWRAAHVLQRHTGCRYGADITLHKYLPMGGGLGGGSSDAATVLLVLNRLWGLDLPRPVLQSLALQLGADVPIFVFGQTAFAEGVGEILTPCPQPAASYVVLTPSVHVSTQSIFSHAGLTRDTPSVRIAALSEGFGRNDLEPVVCALYPEVARCLAWLKRFSAARMTGSGACVFAGFPARSEAEAVFSLRPEGLSGFVAEGVDRHPLYGWCV